MARVSGLASDSSREPADLGQTDPGEVRDVLAALHLRTGGDITNLGTFKKSSGGGTMTVAPDGGNFSGGQGFTIPGGQLTGIGTITGNVTSNGGEVVPSHEGGLGILSITGNHSISGATPTCQ